MKTAIYTIIHISVWLMLYFLSLKLAGASFFYNPVMWGTGILAFYINIYVFIPAYLHNHRRWFKYTCFTLLVITGLTSIEFGLDYLLKLEPVFIRGRSPNTLVETIIIFGAIAFVKTITVMPLSYLFQFIKDLIVYKKVSVFAEISLHILIIAMFYLLRITEYPQWAPEKTPFLFLFKAVYSFILVTISLSFFYLNSFWFIPSFLTKRKYIPYFSSLILMIAGSILMELAIYSIPVFSPEQTNILTKTVVPSLAFKLLILLASFLYRFTKDWFKHESLRKKLESEKLLAELNLLKLQVHPHFLFNTLNNIYSQAMQEDSPKTVQSIARLSGLMRYMLEECNQDLVLLNRELEYIRDYISLQKLRIDLRNQIKTDYKTDQSDGLLIAPMLLIPFIENAFKYGISNKIVSFILMKIAAIDDKLIFSIQNPIHEHKNRQISTGLGLLNVRQRLTHLYPDNHMLSINDQDGIFDVNLTIKLSYGLHSNRR